MAHVAFGIDPGSDRDVADVEQIVIINGYLIAHLKTKSPANFANHRRWRSLDRPIMIVARAVQYRGSANGIGVERPIANQPCRHLGIDGNTEGSRVGPAKPILQGVGQRIGTVESIV